MPYLCGWWRFANAYDMNEREVRSMALNDNIKKIREEKKYTQQQLADKLYVSRQTVCRWENGSRCPDLITAKKLAMELGVTLDELISDEDITDIQSKYGIWKFDRVKEREKIQMMQKRILDFIEIMTVLCEPGSKDHILFCFPDSIAV